MTHLALSPLARRNPTVKLVLLFVVSVVLMFVFDPVTPAVLYLVAAGAVLATSAIGMKRFLLAHLPFVGFAIGLLLVNALSRPGEVLFSGAGLRITVEGLQVGASLGLRSVLIGVLSIGFVVSTDGVRLMNSLHQHARLGARPTYAIVAGYRMLQEMPREWRTIRQAHAVRAPLRKNGQLPRGMGALGRAAFTLLIVSLRKGERMSQALESRGLGLTPRTVWRPVPLTWADAAFAGGVLAVGAAVLLMSARWGVLAGPEMLFG
ncbi:MAG TPA: energy-coupling factor transporter transmembrane component T [Glaciihabitans sp.]|nr:energy-coupling factor transporter transmembrane component T [Glaciihabitans sp.]